MNSKLKFLFRVLIAFLSISLSFAQNASGNTQAKLMARRAAITDGQRQLLEIVQGVEIDSRTTVRDFVAESDEVRSRVLGVIRGAEIIETRHLKDGSCEVDLELHVRQLTRILRKNFPYPNEVLRVTGVGVQNPDSSGEPFIPSEEAEGIWFVENITVSGSGVPPAAKQGTAQGRLLAKRAATVDAQRNMLEQIMGVQVDSKTTVRDFVAESDVVRTRLRGYLRGAQIVDTNYGKDGVVEITLEINLRGVRTIIYDNPDWVIEIVQ